MKLKYIESVDLIVDWDEIDNGGRQKKLLGHGSFIFSSISSML